MEEKEEKNVEDNIRIFEGQRRKKKKKKAKKEEKKE